MKLVCGDDEKLVDEYLTTTINDIAAYQVIRYQNPSQIVEILSQRSFFQTKLQYIIKDCTFLTKAESKTKAKNITTLLKLLLHFKDEDIYLISGTINERTLSNEVADFLKQIEIKPVTKLTRLSVKKHIKQWGQKYNLDFPTYVVDFLAAALPLNTGIIKQEIAKVALIYYDGISTKEINEVIYVENESNVFRLLNIIIHGKITEAIELYDWIVAGKMYPFEVFQVLTSQLFTLKIVCAAFLSGYKPDIIIHQMHLQPFFLKMWSDVLRLTTLKKFVKIFDKMFDLEMELKLGGMEPTSWVRLYIVRFCSLFLN